MDILNFNQASLVFLLSRFLLDLSVILILLFFVYKKLTEIKYFTFVLFVFNILVFFFASFLGAINIHANFAFGLFAVFALLRYRTQTIPIFEMTFLFISIIIAIINSTVTASIGIVEILLANGIIVFVSSMTDIFLDKHRKEFKNITYENMALIRPDKRNELIQDLKKRTGLNISTVDVRNINFLNDTVKLRCFYVSDNLQDFGEPFSEEEESLDGEN